MARNDSDFYGKHIKDPGVERKDWKKIYRRGGGGEGEGNEIVRAAKNNKILISWCFTLSKWEYSEEGGKGGIFNDNDEV